MRRLWLVSPKEATHEEAFLERYDRLLGQALHITERRYSAAEDLVHDAFIQFTLRKPELSAINDLDSYLFIVLRNMHLSQVRRSSYNRFAPISIADYDSAAIGLRSFDIQNQVVVADELLRICDYVCARKETSKAASVLILRFFHGYFTSEIADVINSPRRTVHEWLRLARNEAKAYLDDPKAADSSESLPLKKVGNEHDLLVVLRDRIFSSRQGACLSAKQLNNLYVVENGSPIQCRTLAHIASCRNCLDQVNNIRKLPPFSDRYPTDALGSDTRSSSGGNQMNRVRGADVSKDDLKLCRRRLGEVLDHHPSALSFSANGFILGSQKVNADTTEQVLSINIDEEVSFVEVFSEQGIRLMFMDVTPSSIGGVEQKSRLQLDEGREVECAISFSQPWPTLHVTYRINELTNPSLLVAPKVESDPVVGFTALPTPHLSFISRLVGSGFWLRPEMITAVVICCVALAAAYWYTRKTPDPTTLSANELLEKAVANEDSAIERGSVIHRTISLEEASSNGAVIAKKRVEIWQNVDKGIVVRRLFNDRGELVAGDWRRPDGVQTLYQHGVDPRIQLSPGKRDALPLAFDQIWQLSTSAREFATLASNGNVSVEQGTNTIRLWYEATNSNTTGQRIVNASLTLNRSDLHVLSQTLLVQQGSDIRSFRFVETSVEKHSSEKVPATIFEPDPSFVPAKKKESAESTTTNEADVATPPTTNSPAVATADLEIEVLRVLNQVEADTGEQIFVRRTASGTLLVDGVVELTSRKQQILQALKPVIGNPALKVNLETVDERVARETSTRRSSDSISLERIQVASNSIPLEPDLRQYFASRGVPNNQIDDEVKKLSRTALAHSSQALQHAGALTSLTSRFSLEELKTLDSASRAKWLALVQKHAQGLRTNVVLLQRELGEALGQPRSDVFAEPSIEDDALLIQAVNRLFTTVSAIDQSVRATLSLSNNPGSAAKIKGIQFWRSLAIAEDLASKVASSK